MSTNDPKRVSRQASRLHESNQSESGATFGVNNPIGANVYGGIRNRPQIDGTPSPYTFQAQRTTITIDRNTETIACFWPPIGITPLQLVKQLIETVFTHHNRIEISNLRFS